MKLSLSASSGIVKSSEADIAEPGTDESRRQRRGRFYRRLALALHPNGQGVEQHRAFAGAIDGIARNRDADPFGGVDTQLRSAEHTSAIQPLMRITYAVFCLTKQ